MSYDLEIRSDDKYSEKADIEPLRAFVMKLPGIRLSGGQCCCYEDPQLQLYMEIDLEVVDEKGDRLDFILPEVNLLDKNSVNCIRLHVPYAHMHSDYRDQQYIDVGLKLAHQLHWHLYDCQLNTYLD